MSCLLVLSRLLFCLVFSFHGFTVVLICVLLYSKLSSCCLMVRLVVGLGLGIVLAIVLCLRIGLSLGTNLVLMSFLVLILALFLMIV